MVPPKTYLSGRQGIQEHTVLVSATQKVGLGGGVAYIYIYIQTYLDYIISMCTVFLFFFWFLEEPVVLKPIAKLQCKVQ